MKEKYCNYCQRYKPQDGFKQLFKGVHRTPMAMCKGCQDRRALGREALAELDRALAQPSAKNHSRKDKP